MSAMTLEQKVRTVLFADDTGDGPISQCREHPAGPGHVTEYEEDVRDWGCTYGIAFGIARCEEPCETIAQVASRALEAAWHVYVEYSGDRFARPDVRKEIDEMVKAHGLEDVLAELESRRTAEAVAS